MYLLIPGRHHALTWFQFRYLYRFANAGLAGSRDLDGEPLPDVRVTGVVFAVTSANHAGTKRNPLPFLLRAMALQDFSGEFDLPVWVVGIPDVGQRPDFASYVLKTIAHELDLNLTPQNTLAVGSSPVLRAYRALGFRVWGAEAETWADVDSRHYHAAHPWDLVERAARPGWEKDPELLMELHPACFKLWKRYRIGERLHVLFADPIVGADGDLTSSRDYGAYVRQMDEIAALKWQETGPYVRAGVIGDIGCAVGSWIRHASEDPRFQESDFYGIEIARPLFEICQQRKANGEFANPNVWFAQRNAVTGLVFRRGSMTTVHTGSLTHEIESYGGRADLLAFIRNRYQELAPGGVWINRDVVGPPDGEEDVTLELLPIRPGRDEPYTELPRENTSAERALRELSPLGLWRQFIQDWLPGRPRPVVTLLRTEGRTLIRAPLRLISEFLLHKDYTDNWTSEMHETFCFWSFEDWKQRLEEAGFRVSSDSRVWTNTWILQNRWLPTVRLWKDPEGTVEREWPPTTMLLVAEA